MQHLQHNTAATVVLGPMVDWRDGKTLITDTPSVSDLTCTLYKNGTGSAKTLAGNLTVDANGMALLTLSAGDTDTVGRLDIVLANAVDGEWTTEIIVPRSCALTVLSAAGVAALHNGPTFAGTGEVAFVYSLTSTLTAAPIPQAKVWVSTDPSGVNIVAAGYTNHYGQVPFQLTAGPHYFWRQKSGWQFNNPDYHEVAA